MEYDFDARQRLGRLVRQTRRARGLGKTAEWAAKVGRSDRVLLGLERGEAVGADTYAAVADALGVRVDFVYGALDGVDVRLADYESIKSPTPPALTSVSDDELAAEVLRRMKNGGERHGDATTTKAAGSGRRLDVVHHPLDDDLDALPDEADDPPPIQGGRSLPDAARRTDND